METVKYFCFITIFLNSAILGLSLVCHSCQSGISNQTSCSYNLAKYAAEDCEGSNAQCYEALKSFQNGALQLVERRCWVPPSTTNETNYCKFFKNNPPLVTMDFCRTCKTDECNTKKDFLPKKMLPSRNQCVIFKTK